MSINILIKVFLGYLIILALFFVSGLLRAAVPYHYLFPNVYGADITGFIEAVGIYVLSGYIAAGFYKSKPIAIALYLGILSILLDLFFDLFLLPNSPRLALLVERLEQQFGSTPLWMYILISASTIPAIVVGGWLRKIKLDKNWKI